MEISWGLEIYTKDIWPTVLKVSGPSGQRFKDLDMSQEAVLIAGRERERKRELMRAKVGLWGLREAEVRAFQR